MKYFFPVIHSKPLGQREFPLVYLQRRDKPAHMTWEHWYSFANNKYRQSQKVELQQQEEIQKQREYEENMATALTMDFLSCGSFEFTPSEGNGITSSLMDNNLKEQEKETSVSNGGALAKKVTETECDIGNKTVELSKDVQDVILEIANLFLDPDVVFAMRKLKEIGKAMKGSPSVDAITHEAALVTNLEKAKQAQLLQTKEMEVVIDKKDIKQEENANDQKKHSLHKPLFPSATRATTFEQFSNIMKAPKKRFGSPSKGAMLSPKSAKKSGSTQLKSLMETKMDIISEGLNVLK